MKSFWHKLTPDLRGLLTALALIGCLGIGVPVFYLLDSVSHPLAIGFWVVILLLLVIFGNGLPGLATKYFKKLWGK